MDGELSQNTISTRLGLRRLTRLPGEVSCTNICTLAAIRITPVSSPFVRRCDTGHRVRVREYTLHCLSSLRSRPCVTWPAFGSSSNFPRPRPRCRSPHWSVWAAVQLLDRQSRLDLRDGLPGSREDPQNLSGTRTECPRPMNKKRQIGLPQQWPPLIPRRAWAENVRTSRTLKIRLPIGENAVSACLTCQWRGFPSWSATYIVPTRRTPCAGAD